MAIQFVLFFVMVISPALAGEVKLNTRIEQVVAEKLPALLDLYIWFHQNPELSLQEEKTAARFAAELRQAGWQVTEQIGGFGVVAVLQNGVGPTILARVDMDGLPVQEETGLPYSSQNEGIMHACGHDVHLATGVGLASALAELREHWQGNVVLIGQPAEEVGKGAANMLKDKRFASLLPDKPIACLSIHDSNALPAGTVALCPGWATANVDSVDITIYGKGGHGAWPHQTVDPIVISSELVMALQTIVSRKIDPQRRAVITVGSIHGGSKHNIIPNEVKLQLTVRSYEEDTRQELLKEIRYLAEQIASAHHAPKMPEVSMADEYVPAGYNDPELSQKMQEVFSDLLGKENVLQAPPMMGGEDFSRFARHFNVPGLQFAVGAVNKKQFQAGDPIPSLHSSQWAVDPQPTLRTSIATLTRACVELLPTH